MKDATTLSHSPAVSNTPPCLLPDLLSEQQSEPLSDSVAQSVSSTVLIPLAKPIARPPLSLSHNARMGLVITFVALIGVVIWVVIELSL